MGELFDPYKYYDICVLNKNKLKMWLGMWFGISSTCGVKLNGKECYRETDEEHGNNGVEKGFQLAWVKLDGGGKGAEKTLRWGVVILLFEKKQN